MVMFVWDRYYKTIFTIPFDPTEVFAVGLFSLLPKINHSTIGSSFGRRPGFKSPGDVCKIASIYIILLVSKNYSHQLMLPWFHDFGTD